MISILDVMISNTPCEEVEKIKNQPHEMLQR